MINNKVTLAISMGDKSGVSPEILVNIFKKNLIPEDTYIVIIGSKKSLSDITNKNVTIIDTPNEVEGGLNVSGYQSGFAIKKAFELVSSKEADALVTGPVSKENLKKGGFNFKGHTDFLATLSNIKNPTMMMENSKIRVSLVTIHEPFSMVPKLINHENIISTIKNTINYLREDLLIKKPRVGVLGLNPHAGENGLLGKEEINIITPAILYAKRLFSNISEISGPYSGDTFFSVNYNKDLFDAGISMYHDQGLIPIKLLGFNETINITLGLPFIRTSPSHGTGFDIVNKGVADIKSFLFAILHARRLVINRKQKK